MPDQRESALVRGLLIRGSMLAIAYASASFSTVTLILLITSRCKRTGTSNFAQALDWLIELELAPIDVEALALQCFRNVRRSDRTKQVVFLADSGGARPRLTRC